MQQKDEQAKTKMKQHADNADNKCRVKNSVIYWRYTFVMPEKPQQN